MKSITIISDDKIGLLAEISYILAKKDINIEALDLDVVGKKAVVSLVVENAGGAKEALKSSGYHVADDNCIMIKLVDRPGEFNRVASMLTHEGIGIEKVHMITKSGKEAILSLFVDNPTSASKVLQDYLAASESSI